MDRQLMELQQWPIGSFDFYETAEMFFRIRRSQASASLMEA